MLEDLYAMPFFLRRHRTGLFGPYVDDLAESLVAKGYTAHSIRGVLRGMCAFGEWLATRGHRLDEVDDRLVARFAATIRCSKWTRRSSYHTGPRHVLDFLRSKGVIAAAPPPPPDHQIVIEFSAWMTEHRGVRAVTVEGYLLLVRELLQTLRGDVSRLTPRRLRAFVLRRVAMHAHTRACNFVSATRMFVRFLVASGRCDAALVAAVPAVASWRETSVPRHLQPDDVARVIAACDVKAPAGLRDRAVVLLLARLGLRAGDVASLTLDAFDWKQARLRVAGKARREDWLPLPQDAGDAVLAYLENARPRIRAEAVFFNAKAPFIPISRPIVSAIVGRAIRRAGVKSPSHGAHVLRHSAAVRMLRAGSSLSEIGALLRHASIETTFHYAKVDRDLLLAVAAPWPTPPRQTTPFVGSRSIALPWLGVS
jgi:site-specific recombinase XerD